ncbi:protein ELYS isoform X2 [Lissotriton helveticus]
MQDQVARVKSSLLLFPEVTLEALGEDEITLDSILRGKFAPGQCGFACLACGPHLEIVNSVTGERLSAYRFSGVTEQPPTVLAVKEFSWQKREGLLVGIEEVEGSVLCLYDLGLSRVVKAVVLPGRVTAIEPIINHGGASASTQHLHQSLRWFFGVAAVVTDVGHILLVDLCLDDLSCSHDEMEASDLEVMSGISADIPHIRENVTRQRRHLCLQLLNPSGNTVTSLYYISRTNHLAVGFATGYLSLWNMKTLKRDYHCLLEGGRVPVYAVTFQEPENDPRNCCYLWAVQSTQESEGDLVSLHLLQLAFGDRKCLASGQILYEGLEYCEERYSLDLTGGILSLRNQTSNTRLLGCQTVERFRSHGERDDSLNEAISPDTSVSFFSWQVNIYGQGKPSTYLAVFDINRWYHAQMPDSLRPGEFLQNCPYFTLWSLDAVVAMTSPHYILDVLVQDRSLSRGMPSSYPPPDQFFNPSTYNFDAICLLNSGLVHVTCSGLQKRTLHFLKKSVPFSSDSVTDVYNRCLVAGLLSPRVADIQASSLNQEEQLHAVLSAAVGTCSLGLLTGSIKQWTSEEQPRSAANLRFILEWTWNKVISTKEELDQLCASLFDGSCNFIDSQTLQALQHCQLRLSNLRSILNCFLTEAQDVTKKGFIELNNKKLVAILIFQYAQVVLWFCRAGLLPECSDINADMQLSRPFYDYHSLQNYYIGRRQKLERLSRGKWNADCLMIDGILSQSGDRIVKLWSRDEGGTGKYPPVTLHAFLDIYLLENVDETMKHAITIYLLLDIIYSIPSKAETAIESFPTAFGVPWGLVKLIQGFWLLDHNDHKNSLDGILHPATCRSLLTLYHTRIIHALMCQGEYQQALRYIQMMKPPLTSSSEVTLHLTVLLYNRSIVEAMNLLRLHSTRLNVKELLKHMYEACQEMGLMEDLLKLPFTDLEQECLENFLQTNGGVKNQEFLLVHHLQRANYISALQLNMSLKCNLMNEREPRFRERGEARNSILDQYGKVLPRVQMRLAAERTKPYSLPSSALREVSRPTPLSTVVKQSSRGKAVSKATFINHVLTKIRELSSNEHKETYSPYKSFYKEESLAPEPFVGTPSTNASQRMSRLLTSVVHPGPQSSPELSGYQQGPVKENHLLIAAPNPLESNARKSGQKNFLKAAEFGLLETPLVVRRAKALSTCGGTPAFLGFTPQSILRSSLRTTPMESPCVSPGRSVTPPLRSKETKITFVEENGSDKWSSGLKTPSDCKAKLLLFDSPLLRCSDETSAAWTNGTEKVSSFESCPPVGFDLDLDESSLSAPENSSSQMDASKEVSNVSARSGQSTLEFHDAESPEEFERGGVVVASNPQCSALERTAMFQKSHGQDVMPTNEHLDYQQINNGQLHIPQMVEKATEEPSELNMQHENEALTVHELQVLQQQRSFSSENQKELMETEAEYLIVPNNEDALLESVTTVQDIHNPTCLLPPVDSEFFGQDFGEKPLSIKSSTCTSESTGADVESVITIHDSDDFTSTLSENKFEESYHADSNEDNIDMETLEKMKTGEEYTSLTGIQLEFIDPITTQIYTFEKDGQLEIQAEETRALSICKLNSSGTSGIHPVFEQTEEIFTLEFTDGNVAAECELSDTGTEISVAQNNFTLILEEGEAEQALSSLDSPEKVASLIGKSVEVNMQDIKSSVCDVPTKEQSITRQLSLSHSTNVIEDLPFVSEHQVPQVQSVVSQPVKDAVLGNFINVYSTTGSNEDLSEVLTESVCETVAQIYTSRTSGEFSETPVESVDDADAKVFNVSHGDDLLASEMNSKGQSIEDPGLVSSQQSSLKKNNLDPEAVSTPRRTRRTKELRQQSEEIFTDEQVSLIHTPKRVSQKGKFSSPKAAEDISFSANVEENASVLRSGLRSSKETVAEPPKALKVENLPLENIKLLDTPKRFTRSTNNLTEEQISHPLVGPRDIQVPSTPSRNESLSRYATLELPENITSRPEREHIDPGLQLSLSLKKGAKTVRGRATEGLKSHMMNSSKLMSNHEEFELPTTPRRSSRRGALSVSEVTNMSPKVNIGESNPTEIEHILPTRRQARKGHARKTDHVKDISQQTLGDISLEVVKEIVDETKSASQEGMVKEISQQSSEQPLEEMKGSSQKTLLEACEETVKSIPQPILGEQPCEMVKVAQEMVHEPPKEMQSGISQQTQGEPHEVLVKISNHDTKSISYHSTLHSVAETDSEAKDSPHLGHEGRLANVGHNDVLSPNVKLNNTGLASPDAPSSEEKLRTARKSNLFKDEENVSDQKLPDATKIALIEADSVNHMPQSEGISWKVQQPPFLEQGQPCSSVIKTSSTIIESNHLVIPNYPIVLEHGTHTNNVKDDVDFTEEAISNQKLPSEEASKVPLTAKRGGRGRNKSVIENSENPEPIVSVPLIPLVDHHTPFTPRRSSRRGAASLSDVMDGNPPGVSGLMEQGITLTTSSRRSKRGKASQANSEEDGVKSTAEGTSEDSSNEIVFQTNRGGSHKDSLKNQSTKTPLPSVSEETTVDRGIPSPESRERLHITNILRSPRLRQKEMGADDNDGALKTSFDNETLEIKQKPHSKVTQINKQEKLQPAVVEEESIKIQVPSVFEESIVDRILPSLGNHERLHCAENAITRSTTLHRTRKGADVSETLTASSEDEVQVVVKQRRGTRMTKINDKQKRVVKTSGVEEQITKPKIPSVSEESTAPSLEGRERLLADDNILGGSPVLQRKETLAGIDGSSKETHTSSIKEVAQQKRGLRMTKTNEKQKIKIQPSIIAEESMDKVSSDTPERMKLLGTDNVLTLTRGRYRKEETVAEHSITRTRSSKLSAPPYISLDAAEHFVFSPPSTKRKHQKAGETRQPVVPLNLDPDVSAQFVYSPPAMRTRRKDQLNISEVVKERDILIQETEVSDEPAVKRRGRPPKSKTKGGRSSDKVPWSPPPVEVNLISPMPSPATEASSKAQASSDEGTEKRTLRRNRKRLLSAFTKPVTRRKMR